MESRRELDEGEAKVHKERLAEQAKAKKEEEAPPKEQPPKGKKK